MNRFNNGGAAENYLNEYRRILDKMIDGMTRAPLTDSISNNFIVQMIPHHMAAIEMSENLMRYTRDETMQSIARNIISEQTQSIANMKAVYSTCLTLINPARAVSAYENRINSIMCAMFSQMKTARSDGNINCDFLREMIPHHLGAVRMSETALHFNICRGLVPILNEIIATQRRGIRRMQSLERQCHSR
ncbi:MAG: DUF305 domain-containing protein [Oscillospiraceae bacterium]|nr:DUF305 domain-containing protein [Oscillospiraceae bacterium]